MFKKWRILNNHEFNSIQHLLTVKKERGYGLNITVCHCQTVSTCNLILSTINNMRLKNDASDFGLTIKATSSPLCCSYQYHHRANVFSVQQIPNLILIILK